MITGQGHNNIGVQHIDALESKTGAPVQQTLVTCIIRRMTLLQRAYMVQDLCTANCTCCNWHTVHMLVERRLLRPCQQ